MLPANTGRSSDSQARPAVTFSRSQDGLNRLTRNGSEISRPVSHVVHVVHGKSPGYSGGAVPESHRSSLFALRSQLREEGHQIQWRSVTVAPPLSSCATSATTSRTPSHAALRAVKLYRLRSKTDESVRVVRHCAAQNTDTEKTAFFSHNTPQVVLKKILGYHSSRFPLPADSPHVPRGITVPVGQLGGGNHLQILRVTDWLDRSAARQFRRSQPRGDQTS